MHTENLAHSLGHLCRHWESRHAAATKAAEPGSVPHPFTITVSREAGTPGTQVAREIGKGLGWDVYDNELLERIAEDMGVRAALLKNVDERRLSWIAEVFEASMPRRVNNWESPVSESAYVHHLIKTVQALGALGNCVIVGRGAAFILPSQTTFRVRLVGQAQARIAAFASKQGITEREAARKLRDIDRERADFVHDWFFRDVADPRNYDLMINAARLPVGRIADLVTHAVHRLEDQATNGAPAG